MSRQTERSLSVETTAALRDFAARRGSTLNTLVQTAWGVVLATLTGREDVVFGATVSGRPPEVPGIEGMIGLFINTLPVRVTLDRTGAKRWVHWSIGFRPSRHRCWITTTSA